MKLAIIPARGGSKRIPKKNIKLFHNKPIIYYSIKALVETKIFDKIIVSTDDLEIASIAKQYGAEIPFIRPSDISDDMSTTSDVINHAINWYYNKNKTIDFICCLYATSPFVQALDIINSVHLLLNNNKSKANCILSATEFSYPIARAFSLNKDNFIQMLWPNMYDKRSQDVGKYYHDAGMFYIAYPSKFLSKEILFNNNSQAYVIPNYRVHDIDTMNDWIRAEKIYQALYL